MARSSGARHIPREASVLSALGFLAADVRHDFQKTLGMPIPDVGAAQLRDVFAELERQGRELLREEGFSDADIVFERVADCRYLRQVFTVGVPVDGDELAGGGSLGWLVSKFEASYQELYQHVHKNEPGFIDTCRVAAFGRLPAVDLPVQEEAGSDPSVAQRGARQIYCGGWTEAPVYWFESLSHGMCVEGPALIDSPSTSVFLPPGSTARMDRFGSAYIRPGDAA
ncbi:MAG: hypothetical protein WD270_12860 [Acetobacterales bacterium]